MYFFLIEMSALIRHFNIVTAMLPLPPPDDSGDGVERTCYRSQAMGVVSFLGRVGSMIAPFTATVVGLVR